MASENIANKSYTLQRNPWMLRIGPRTTNSNLFYTKGIPSFGILRRPNTRIEKINMNMDIYLSYRLKP